MTKKLSFRWPQGNRMILQELIHGWIVGCQEKWNSGTHTMSLFLHWCNPNQHNRRVTTLAFQLQVALGLLELHICSYKTSPTYSHSDHLCHHHIGRQRDRFCDMQVMHRYHCAASFLQTSLLPDPWRDEVKQKTLYWTSILGQLSPCGSHYNQPMVNLIS